MQPARVVVIEDEQAIRRGVSDALRASGYEAAEAGDGVRGLEEAVRVGVDLVLLDLMLPRRDGLNVLAEVRRTRPTLPVIILTARGGEDDRVRGLKMGADDYIVKPFSARELLARVEAVLAAVALGRPREACVPPAGPGGDRPVAPGNPLVGARARRVVGDGDRDSRLSLSRTASGRCRGRKQAVPRLGHRCRTGLGDADGGHARLPGAAHQAPATRPGARRRKRS